MPIHPDLRALYPPDWPEISRRIRFERAGNCCEWCFAANHWFHPQTGSVVVLAVAHLDHDPSNNADDNLAALCQACHNATTPPNGTPTASTASCAGAGQLPFAGLEPPLI